MADKCLTPDCRNKGLVWRGLCSKCHETAKRLVDGGKVTWERLAELGLATGKRGVTVASEDPFLKALRQKEAGDA